ncbi:MAG: hypothetical protein K8F24_09775, partial [Bacteroidales bacterium]|nr:hypothetical protein [Bacteroidales bacterium]
MSIQQNKSLFAGRFIDWTTIKERNSETAAAGKIIPSESHTYLIYPKAAHPKVAFFYKGLC